MKRFLAVVAVALSTACGVQPTGVIRGAPAPTEQVSGVFLFFLNGTTLTRVARPPLVEPIKDPLALLGKGPTDQERRQGLTTQIPAAAAPIFLSIKNGQATVTIRSPAEALPAAAKDQIACTASPPWQRRRLPVVITGPDKTIQAPTCPFHA